MLVHLWKSVLFFSAPRVISGLILVPASQQLCSAGIPSAQTQPRECCLCLTPRCPSTDLCDCRWGPETLNHLSQKNQMPVSTIFLKPIPPENWRYKLLGSCRRELKLQLNFMFSNLHIGNGIIRPNWYILSLTYMLKLLFHWKSQIFNCICSPINWTVCSGQVPTWEEQDSFIYLPVYIHTTSYLVIQSLKLLLLLYTTTYLGQAQPRSAEYPTPAQCLLQTLSNYKLHPF